jgi:hypothetical protein
VLRSLIRVQQPDDVSVAVEVVQDGHLGSGLRVQGLGFRV